MILAEAWPTPVTRDKERQISQHVLQGCDYSRYTKDMKNNMEARMYAQTHIVLARVQYEEKPYLTSPPGLAN